MNWKKPFTDIYADKSLDDVKTGINFLTFLTLFIFVGDTVYTVFEFYGEGTTVTIPVRTGVRHVGVEPVSYIDAYGSYSTGSIGELEYKARNVFEVILYKDWIGLNIFSLLYMVIVVLVLRQSIIRVTDKEVFSRRLRNAFKTVGIITCLYFPIGGQFFDQLRYSMLRNWTNNTYVFDELPNYWLYIVLGILIGLSSFFIQKGEELQEDKSLTI